MDGGKLSVVVEWKQANWQWCDTPLWAAKLWQDVVAQVENVIVKAPRKMLTYARAGALKNTERMDRWPNC